MKCYKPLSSESKKKYIELFAKATICEYFPNEYTEIKTQDRPDLLDTIQNIGIEVTQAINENYAKAINEFSLLGFETDKRKINKRLNILHKMNEKLDEYDTWNVISCTEENIINAIIKKNNKYDSYKCKTVDLFIYAVFLFHIPHSEERLKTFGNRMLLKMNDLNVKYRYIYLAVTGYIYRFDIRSANYVVKEFPNEKATDLGFTVRKYIENKVYE